MAEPKIDVCLTPQGRHDLITFFVKGSPLPAGVPAEEFDGSPCGLLLMREGETRTLFVGLGDKSKIDRDTIRRAAGTAVKHLLKIGSRDLALDLHEFADDVGAAVEGALLASYKFGGVMRDADRKPRGTLASLQVMVEEHELVNARLQAEDAAKVCAITNQMRDIGNLPGNLLTPAVLAEKAQELASSRPSLTVKIWNERHLKRDGFGGLLAVGAGSHNPPRFIVLEYNGSKRTRGSAPIALLGKAVTFDTGGISIKPGAQMDEMKWDKMGGLAVLGVLLAVADLELPVHLVGLIPCAENMPGPDAYRPGDIISTFDGKTVEVLNTDAEGRIILADAMAYARTNYKPTAMIEFSTLTGAVIMALGFRRAGLFTAEDRLREALVEAGKLTGELLWPLPIDEEYKEGTLSEVATVKNIGAREGSACISATFLKTWAEDVPFAHLDIAGTAWTTKPPAHLEAGATGFGIRLMIQALKSGRLV